MSQSIPLSRGKVALVDDDDYARLSAYEWFLSGTGYAVGFVPTQRQVPVRVHAPSAF